MKKIISIVIVIATVAAVLFFYENSNPQVSNKVGVILPLSGGPVSSYGEAAKNGIELAIADTDIPIEVTYEDSQGIPRVGVQAFSKLQSSGHNVIVGDLVSGVTLAFAPVAEENQTIVIAPGAAAPDLTHAGDYIFRTKMVASSEVDTTLEILGDKLGVEKLAVLYLETPYGEGVFNSLTAKSKHHNIEILGYESYPLGETNFRTQLTKLKSLDPTHIFLVGWAKDLGLMLRQANELEINSDFLAHSGSIGPDIVTTAGTAAEGLTFAYEIDLSQEKTREFAETYRQTYNTEPEMFSYLAYDSFMLAAKAISICGNNTNCVKDKLYQTDRNGVSGDLSFDKYGDVVRSKLKLMKVTAGEFTELEQESKNYRK